MATAALLRNRKRFLKEFIAPQEHETIIGGQADGEVMIIEKYAEYCCTKHDETPKRYHMSLFPTTKRIAVYAACGGLKKDLYAAIPIKYLRIISFEALHQADRILCITEFIADDESPCPSIIFKLSTVQYDDITGYYSTLRTIVENCPWVRFDDATNYPVFHAEENKRQQDLAAISMPDSKKKKKKNKKQKSKIQNQSSDTAVSVSNVPQQYVGSVPNSEINYPQQNIPQNKYNNIVSQQNKRNNTNQYYH